MWPKKRQEAEISVTDHNDPRLCETRVGGRNEANEKRNTANKKNEIQVDLDSESRMKIIEEKEETNKSLRKQYKNNNTKKRKV